MRESTLKAYINIWRSFNSFLLRLDKRPPTWENRLCLFGAYLVDRGYQSSTIKSYFSAIKAILWVDNYELDMNSLVLQTLTKSCQRINDVYRIRQPISHHLLELMLFELRWVFPNQPYLQILYQTMLAVGYFGMLRVSEMTRGQHALKASDVHLGINKNKLLLVLYSSKTHNQSCRPQKIKIVAATNYSNTRNFFCPFDITRQYLKVHGGYFTVSEQFFVFKDRSPVRAEHILKIIRLTIAKLNLNPKHFGTHSLRIRRCTDLVKDGCPIEKVKLLGRWKSNAVFKYIR